MVRITDAAAPIIALLDRVESGETNGAAGCWAANGQAIGPDKLRAVTVPIELLRNLRKALEEEIGSVQA